MIIRREVGDRAGEGTTLNNIGAIYCSQGKYDQALESYKQALVIARDLGLTEMEQSIQSGIATSLHYEAASRVQVESVIWDVFISHASEDKETVVIPLAEGLRREGLRVWVDQQELTLGDNLRRKIDEGLRASRYGIVVLSQHFFAKEWPQKELDALVAREDGKQKVILPIWHQVSREDVLHFSPLLAGIIAVNTSQGIDAIVQQVLRVVNTEKS